MWAALLGNHIHRRHQEDVVIASSRVSANRTIEMVCCVEVIRPLSLIC